MDWKRAISRAREPGRPAACVAACLAAAVGVPVLLAATERAGTPAVLRVEVLPEPASFVADGVRCDSTELRALLGERASRLGRDEDGLSVLRVEAAAPPRLPYDRLERLMDICAAERVPRVTWRVGGEAVAADIHRDRTPPGLFFSSSPELYVRVGRSTEGEPFVKVNKCLCKDADEAEALLGELKERVSELPVQIVPLPGARIGDVFAAMRAVRRVCPDEVELAYVSVPAPSRPGDHWSEGMRDARADAAKGRHAIISYGLPSGMAWWYEQVLLEGRYGIVSDHRGCCIEHGDAEYIEAYNHVSRQMITAKFGRDVVAECEADAEAYECGGIRIEGDEIGIDPETGMVVYRSP